MLCRIEKTVDFEGTNVHIYILIAPLFMHYGIMLNLIHVSQKRGSIQDLDLILIRYCWSLISIIKTSTLTYMIHALN